MRATTNHCDEESKRLWDELRAIENLIKGPTHIISEDPLIDADNPLLDRFYMRQKLINEMINQMIDNRKMGARPLFGRVVCNRCIGETISHEYLDGTKTHCRYCGRKL